MQDTLRFLEAVLPAQGTRVAAHKPPSWKKGVKHQFVETNAELVEATGSIDAAGVDAYFALATFRDPEAGRSAVNASHLQCLWLDLDFKQYESPQAARDSLAPLIQRIGAPSIQVASGGGLHVYWCLRGTVDVDRWKPLADAFQKTFQSFDIKADPVSADAARILRVPGTRNFKYDPPATVVIEAFEDLTYDVDALAAKLQAPTRRALTVPAGFGISFDDLGANIDRRPSFHLPIIRQCQQIRYAVLNQDKLAEPHWYAVVQLVRHVENGREVAHKFSVRHPSYSAEETDAKLDQLEARDIGPTTCLRFQAINPGGCAGCPQKITSPIQLGYPDPVHQDPIVEVKRIEIDAVTGERVETTTQEALGIEMPRGYAYDGKRMTFKPANQPTVEFFEGYFRVERIAIAEQGQADVRMRVAATNQIERMISLPARVLADKRDLARELQGKGVFFMSEHTNLILGITQKMAQNLQARQANAVTAEQMGWQRSGEAFVVGTTAYGAGDPVYDLPVPGPTRAVAHYYQPVGSLEAWRRTAEVYHAEGAEAYQFALCYGAAGVFLPMTRLSGAVVSLYSQSAGRGKSTAGFGALSWWGDPNGLKSQSKDTNNALFGKASRHKNLPILMDEVTDKSPAELEDLVYYMTQGREKESLTADRTPRAILPSWALPVISTSNNSLRSKLQAKRGDAQGLFARIIEIPMDLPFAERMGYTDRMQLRSGFVDNHGLAGASIVQFALKNKELVSHTLNRVMAVLDQAVDGDSAYRFWTATVASTVLVATAARKIGMLSYDPGRLLRWSVELLKSQKLEAAAQLATPEDIIAQFLEQNANRILVAYTRVSSGARYDALWPENGVVGNQIVGRAEFSERSLFVSVPAFSRFCHERGFDVGAFMRNASAIADPTTGTVLLKREGAVSVNLGRGSKVATARARALEFNLVHPALREYAAGIDSQIDDTKPLRIVT